MIEGRRRPLPIEPEVWHVLTAWFELCNMDRCSSKARIVVVIKKREGVKTFETLRLAAAASGVAPRMGGPSGIILECTAGH